MGNLIKNFLTRCRSTDRSNAKITKDGEIVLFQGQRQEHIS
jgi:hypothetical protein